MKQLPSIRPCAQSVRARLKEVGLEHLVEAVTSSKSYTRVRLEWDEGSTRATAEQVAEALRSLWHDGAQRVRVLYGGLVLIEREGYFRTVPNTPEGLAALYEAERERNDLLRAEPVVMSSDYSTVHWSPDERFPRQPWEDRLSRRFTPFEVYKAA